MVESEDPEEIGGRLGLLRGDSSISCMLLNLIALLTMRKGTGWYGYTDDNRSAGGIIDVGFLRYNLYVEKLRDLVCEVSSVR